MCQYDDVQRRGIPREIHHGSLQRMALQFLPCAMRPSPHHTTKQSRSSHWLHAVRPPAQQQLRHFLSLKVKPQSKPPWCLSLTYAGWQIVSEEACSPSVARELSPYILPTQLQLTACYIIYFSLYQEWKGCPAQHDSFPDLTHGEPPHERGSARRG